MFTGRIVCAIFCMLRLELKGWESAKLEFKQQVDEFFRSNVAWEMPPDVI